MTTTAPKASTPRRSRPLVQWLDRKLYPGIPSRWDDERLRAEVLKHLTPGSRLLDLGAGAGIVPQMNFRGLGATVCGIDPDPRVACNPHLDEAHVGYGESIPYPDAHFDVVVADNVLEHLDDPDAVFHEVARVLKPGGVFLAKTPNAWHYVPTIARFTPLSFHRFVCRLRGRAGSDTFPTRYRANTRPAIAAIGARNGLALENYVTHEDRPEYLRMTAPTYVVGWMYERAVNTLPGGAQLRSVLIATLRKQAAEARNAA
ncbi:MAG: class I SAM-dependent methyltransferase [Planctomycetota bacterium]|nr:class I SAM-dependent methyltransferase [Planctomycetota bacterium]